MKFDALIIGAGPAGCAAAIHMSQRGFRVLLLERKRYPSHKLCGEFLSPDGIESLRRLGMLAGMTNAGARPINKALITTSLGATFQIELPGTALGLSRYCLDLLMLRRAGEIGTICHEGERVRRVSGSLQTGFRVSTDAGQYEARVVLGAYGRRDQLDRALQRGFLKRRSPFVALKAHFTGPDLPGLLELHAFPGGYCGLSPIEKGNINVCWIAHAKKIKEVSGNVAAMIEQSLKRNRHLAERLEALDRVSRSFLSVGQIPFASKDIFAGEVCMIGDAAGVIAPLCGDGVAMALRSAEIAAPLVASYLDGHLAAEKLKQAYRHTWETEFGSRLRLGRILQATFLRPSLAALGVSALRVAPVLGQWLVRNTRGVTRSEEAKYQHSYHAVTYKQDLGRNLTVADWARFSDKPRKLK